MKGLASSILGRSIVIYPREMVLTQKKLYICVHGSNIHNSQDVNTSTHQLMMDKMWHISTVKYSAIKRSTVTSYNMNLENIVLSENTKIQKAPVSLRALQRNRTSRIYFRKLVHVIMGAGKSEICRANTSSLRHQFLL